VSECSELDDGVLVFVDTDNHSYFSLAGEDRNDD